MSGNLHANRNRIVATVITLAGGLLFMPACTMGPRLVAPDGSVDWNRYYSTDETHRIMRDYERMYPQLTKLYSIGKSLRGQDLMVLEVTNHLIQPGDEKPGIYVDGNIHAGELTGSAVTLYLMGHLLSNYGVDPEVTELVDSRVWYLRPKFNPDGADLALLEDQSLRSTTRPQDNDGDGLMDEDPGEDLNGDGFITQMRIPDDEGNSTISSEDSRLMVGGRRGRGRGGRGAQPPPPVPGVQRYRVIGEGIDNDGDGRFNEDGIGGLDMNRNFPRNWALEFRQSGAGDFPLSEPETYATIMFINGHRNITSIVHNHTSGGFVYRLPSASDPTKFDTDDLKLIEQLGLKYTETTGRPVRPSATDPVRHRYGTLISWGYWDQGIIGWVPEYWPGLDADYDNDGRTSELERLRFNDEELGGKYFVDWTPFDHPELGPVEIGGWRNKFISQNPPAELLENECAMQMPWIKYLAAQSPMLQMSEPRVTPLGGDRYQIEVTVRNDGFLPTNLTNRGLEAGVIKPVYAFLDISGATIVEGERRVDLGHLPGDYLTGDGDMTSFRTASWVVEVDRAGAMFSVRAVSQKGGTRHSGRMSVGP